MQRTWWQGWHWRHARRLQHCAPRGLRRRRLGLLVRQIELDEAVPAGLALLGLARVAATGGVAAASNVPSSRWRGGSRWGR